MSRFLVADYFLRESNVSKLSEDDEQEGTLRGVLSRTFQGHRISENRHLYFMCVSSILP